MKRKSISRRALLRGAGGAAVGLPILSSLRTGSSTVRAQTEVPTRLVVFFTPNGFNEDGWPTSTNLIGSVLEPLAPYQDQLIVTRGMDMQSALADPIGDRAHYNGIAHMLVGDYSIDRGGRPMGGGISFDMEVSRRVGTRTKHPYSLHGITEDAEAPISWLSAGSGATAELDPHRAFQDFFGGLSTSSPASEPQVDHTGSVLDYVKGSIDRTRCQLGSEDRQRLDAHLTAVEDLEQRLKQNVGGAGCYQPPAPTPYDYNNQRYELLGRDHMDMLAMAFRCDATRVGSLQYGQAASNKVVNHTGRGYHDISHDPTAQGFDEVRGINRWYAGELKRFLDLLSAQEAVQEDGNTLLHHTCVVWISEIGLHRNDSHPRSNLGVVIAGGAGGALRTGQFLDLQGIPHNNLWVELINAVSPSDVPPITTFGNPEFCTGGIDALKA